EDVLAVRRVERAETARAGDLELDDGAGGDLVQRRFLALRLCGEALRVVVERLDPRIGLLRAVLVAGDITVDRRELYAADRADGLGALLLRIEACGVPDEVAGLLLAEEQTFDVLRLVLERRHVDVDDRELVLRERRGDRVHIVLHQEPDADRDARAALG